MVHLLWFLLVWLHPLFLLHPLDISFKIRWFYFFKCIEILRNFILKISSTQMNIFKNWNWSNENLKIVHITNFILQKSSNHPIISQYKLFHFLQPYMCIQHHCLAMAHISYNVKEIFVTKVMFVTFMIYYECC